MKYLEGAHLGYKASLQDRNRVKTSPSSPHIVPNKPRQLDETVLPFHFSEYPFLNTPHSFISTLKTTLSLKLTPQILQNLVNIQHPNIIPIRKISKTTPRQGTYPQQINYCLYYQPVQYSIKHLVDNPQDNIRLYNLLVTFDLKGILGSVMRYLGELGVTHLLRLNDVGITIEGNIKVFVPPTAIADPRPFSRGDKTMQPIVDWWQNVVKSPMCNPFKKQKKNAELQPPKLQNNNDLQFQQSIDQTQLEKELDGLLEDDSYENNEEGQVEVLRNNQLQKSNNSYSKIGSIQMDKINQINEQVRYFKERIKKCEVRSKPVSPKKDKPIDVPKPKNSGLPQPQSIAHNILANKKGEYQEPILQNINCINIYNHNNHVSPRFTSIPDYYQQQPHHGYFLPRNTQPYQYSPQEEEIYEQDDDSLSQDTYDLEFNEFEGNEEGRFHKFSPEERDLSEHPKRKSKEIKLTQFRSKNNVNPVCNKNYTESAGPLQFKQFASKYMKNGRSKEKEEKKGSYGFQDSKIENVRSSSLGPKKIPKLPGNGSNSPRNMSRNNSQQQFIHARTIDRQIHSKVSEALTKTKNAIELLKKVKQNRGRNISMQ